MSTYFRTNASTVRLAAPAIAILVFAGLLSACVPLTAPTVSAAEAAEVTTYHLELFDSEVDGVTTPIDQLTPDDFPGTGDIILEAHNVNEVATQEVVGNSITRVQVVYADAEGDADFLIDCTVMLADGNFHFAGGGKFSGLASEAGVSLPIVGGTGAYTYAAGTVNMKFGALGEVEGAYITADITIGR